MGYTKLDIGKIRGKALSSKKAKDKALEKAEKKVGEEKSILIQEFNNHEVTKEIAAGPKASNTSGTLGGYGNLFSFIGFEANSDPITPVKEILNETDFTISATVGGSIFALGNATISTAGRHKQRLWW